MFVVAVTFALKEGQGRTFLPLVIRNARASLADEPGCLRFDVCANPDTPDEVFLYEVYTDRAGFDAHRTMPHYADFTTGTEPLIASKTVKTYALQTDQE